MLMNELTTLECKMYELFDAISTCRDCSWKLKNAVIALGVTIEYTKIKEDAYESYVEYYISKLEEFTNNVEQLHNNIKLLYNDIYDKINEDK